MLLNYVLLGFTIHFIEILCQNCESNLDCTGNRICQNGQCECDTISYLSKGACINYATEYRGDCKEHEQCKWLGENGECRKNVCVCEENHTWYQGTCQQYAGIDEDCSGKICYDGTDPLAMVCDSSINKCVCNDEYYDRGGYDCRKKMQDNSCGINYDCDQSTEPTDICSHGKCVRKTDNLQLNTYQQEELIFTENEEKIATNHSDNIGCTRDSDCLIMANSVCDAKTSTCRCRDDYFTDGGNCLPGFGVCDKDEDCTSTLANSHCFHGICVCRQGYFYSKKTCVPEIGMAADIKDDKDCKIKASKQQDGACFCIKFWSADEYNRKCIKSIVQENLRCINDYWCNAMGQYSFCNSSQLCQCSSFAELDEETFYCKKVESVPKDGCIRDPDCGFNKRCQNEQCECNEKFLNVNGECLPGLGGPCDIKGCSHIDNSFCLDGICTCNTTEYVGYNNKCLPNAKHWDDDCEVSEQCQKLKFSECSNRNKKCKCIRGYEKVDEQCWESKEYGSPCMTTEDCTKVLNHYYTCRNSKCLCPVGQRLENGFCVNSFSVSVVSSSSSLIFLLFVVFLI